MPQPSKGTKNQVSHLRKDLDAAARSSNIARNLAILSLTALAVNFLLDFIM